MAELWTPGDLERAAAQAIHDKKLSDGMVYLDQDAVGQIGLLVNYMAKMLDTIENGTFGEVKMLAKVGRSIIAGPGGSE